MTKSSWWEKNASIVSYLLIAHMLLVPFIIWLIFNEQKAQQYFLVMGIGIPYIITTIGHLIWYNRAPELKQEIEKQKEVLENLRIEKQESNFTNNEQQKLNNLTSEYNKARSLDDFFFRSSGILKLFVLGAGILFFFGESIDGLNKYLLKGHTVNQTVDERNNETDQSNKDLILQLETKIERLEKDINILISKNNFIINDTIENFKLNDGPKIKY